MLKGISQKYGMKKSKLPKVVLTPKKSSPLSVFGRKIKEPDKGIIFSIWKEGEFDLGCSLRGKKIIS